MKITKSYLMQVIKEELEEARPAPYDPVPPKHMRSPEDQKYSGYEEDFMSSKDSEHWLQLIANDHAQEPGNLQKIIAIAKKDPRRAKSLGKHTRSIGGKIVTLGSEKLGQMVASGAFGKEARDIAKAEAERWSQGQVARAQNIKKRTGQADLSNIGAPIAQVREGKITKSYLKQIIKEELESLEEIGNSPAQKAMKEISNAIEEIEHLVANEEKASVIKYSLRDPVLEYLRTAKTHLAELEGGAGELEEVSWGGIKKALEMPR